MTRAIGLSTNRDLPRPLPNRENHPCWAQLEAFDRHVSVGYPRMRNYRFLILGAALAFATDRGQAQTTYRQADIDSAGQLRLVLSNGKVVLPPRDSGQVGFEQVALSADGRIVGWLALYPNCCTSYPIPLELVLRRMDGSRTMIGNGLPIWQWAFAADGQNVVVRQAPVHGAAPSSYELREIRTGLLIAAVQADSTTALPQWARAAQPKSAPAAPRSNER